MPSTVFEMQAALCQAMSYAARLELVDLLRAGSKQVDELALATGSNQVSVTRHLAALRRCGLVTAERSGHKLTYDLTSPKIAAICDLMREVLADQLAQQAAIARGLS